MADTPGRPFSADDRAAPVEEEGWGSPVPAEYGSLRAVRSSAPAAEPQADEPTSPRGQDGQRDHNGQPERWGVSSILRRLQDVGEALMPSASPAPATTNGSAPVGPAADPVRPAADTARRRADQVPALDPSRRAADPVGTASDWVPPGSDSFHPGPEAASPTSDPALTSVSVPPAEPVPSPRRTGSEPTAAVPTAGWGSGIDPADLGPALSAPEMTLGPSRRRRARRPTRVRTRATIRHLDIMTVIRVSVLFWAVVLITLVVASVLLWTFADAFGTLPSIQKSVRTLFSLKSFQLHPGTIAMYTAAAGVVIAVAGTLASIVLALIYNLIADVVGGVRVELESFTAE